jgi:hypothetical protein
MTPVDLEALDLLLSLRWSREWAAAVREDARERAEIAAEMQELVAQMRTHTDERLARAANRCALATQLQE